MLTEINSWCVSSGYVCFAKSRGMKGIKENGSTKQPQPPARSKKQIQRERGVKSKSQRGTSSMSLLMFRALYLGAMHNDGYGNDYVACSSASIFLGVLNIFPTPDAG